MTPGSLSATRRSCGSASPKAASTTSWRGSRPPTSFDRVQGAPLASGAPRKSSKKDRESSNHATSQIPAHCRDRRCGRRRHRPGGTRHRPVDAGAQLAFHLELPQVARHPVGRGRADDEDRRRGDRQQVPDPHLRGGRDRARPAGARRGAERHGRDGRDRVLLLLRQGPDLRARHRRAVRTEHAPVLGVAEVRQRRAAAERLLQDLQGVRHRHRQHRRPDGRLVPQGDQDGRRSQGLENAHRQRARRPR